MTIVYTTGVFDILHRGHFNILIKASDLGDRLIVGVQDSESVYVSKNKYPVLSTQERIEQLKILPFVYDVYVYKGTDQKPYLKTIKPNILVQGDDWLFSENRSNIIEYLKKNKIRLILFPRTDNISTSEIKQRILNLK